MSPSNVKSMIKVFLYWSSLARKRLSIITPKCCHSMQSIATISFLYNAPPEWYIYKISFNTAESDDISLQGRIKMKDSIASKIRNISALYCVARTCITGHYLSCNDEIWLGVCKHWTWWGNRDANLSCFLVTHFSIWI